MDPFKLYKPGIKKNKFIFLLVFNNLLLFYLNNINFALNTNEKYILMYYTCIYNYNL